MNIENISVGKKKISSMKALHVTELKKLKEKTSKRRKIASAVTFKI